MNKKKTLISLNLVLAILCGAGSLGSIKAQGTTSNLTKAQAVNLAQTNNINALKINTAFSTINRNITKYQELSSEIVNLQSGFQQYKTAYGSLSPSEVSIYTLFNQTEPSKRTEVITATLKGYGYSDAQIAGTLQKLSSLNAAGMQLKAAGLTDSSLKPRELTPELQYEKFVYPREVPVVIAKNMLKKAELQKETINCALDVKVKEGYDAILYGQEGYSLTQKLYDKQLKDYSQLTSKYQVGVVSEVEKDIAELELKKSKLQLDNLDRDVKNGKLQLKQSLGTDIHIEYNFTDEKLAPGELLTYNQYLANAKSSRGEILAAAIDIEEKQYIFDLVKNYYNEDELEYKQADQKLSEAKANYTEISNEVESNIQNSYLEVQQKLSAMQLADTKLQQAEVQYNSVKTSYETGLMTIAMMWNVELGVNQAEMNQSKAQRDYNNAMYKLEQNSKIGTTYVMEGVN